MLAESLVLRSELRDASDVPAPERGVVTRVVEEPRRQLDRFPQVALVDPQHPVGLDLPALQLLRELRVRGPGLERGPELSGELDRIWRRRRAARRRRTRLFLFLLYRTLTLATRFRGVRGLFSLEISHVDGVPALHGRCAGSAPARSWRGADDRPVRRQLVVERVAELLESREPVADLIGPGDPVDVRAHERHAVVRLPRVGCSGDDE